MSASVLKRCIPGAPLQLATATQGHQRLTHRQPHRAWASQGRGLSAPAPPARPQVPAERPRPPPSRPSRPLTGPRCSGGAGLHRAAGSHPPPPPREETAGAAPPVWPRDPLGSRWGPAPSPHGPAAGRAPPTVAPRDAR